MADPVQTRAKDQRRAAALRANLKRRKEQARDRDGGDAAAVENKLTDAAALTAEAAKSSGDNID